MIDNLIDLYVKSRGASEVPNQWFEWAALSGIAACVGDRVKVARCGSELKLNLYVFLVGESGSGKENALKGMMELLGDMEIVNLYSGQTSGPALLDWLSRTHPNTKSVINSCVYLVTRELAYGVGGKEQAESLVRTMTQLYDGTAGVAERQGTRAHGQVVLENCLANWGAGTTEGWLRVSISKEAIESGFWARVIGVRGRREIEKRISRIVLPDGYYGMMDELKRRYFDLACMGNDCLQLSQEAEAIQDEWYQSREFPEDRAALPTAYKADATIHKVAACLKLGDIDFLRGKNCTPIVEAKHMTRALRMLQPIFDDVSYFMDIATHSRLYDATETAIQIIALNGEVPHRDLMQKLSRRYGVTRYDMDQLIKDLTDRGLIMTQPTKSGRGVSYVWRG